MSEEEKFRKRGVALVTEVEAASRRVVASAKATPSSERLVISDEDPALVLLVQGICEVFLHRVKKPNIFMPATIWGMAKNLAADAKCDVAKAAVDHVKNQQCKSDKERGKEWAQYLLVNDTMVATAQALMNLPPNVILYEKGSVFEDATGAIFISSLKTLSGIDFTFSPPGGAKDKDKEPIKPSPKKDSSERDLGDFVRSEALAARSTIEKIFGEVKGMTKGKDLQKELWAEEKKAKDDPMEPLEGSGDITPIPLPVETPPNLGDSALAVVSDVDVESEWGEPDSSKSVGKVKSELKAAGDTVEKFFKTFGQKIDQKVEETRSRTGSQNANVGDAIALEAKQWFNNVGRSFDDFGKKTREKLDKLGEKDGSSSRGRGSNGETGERRESQAIDEHAMYSTLLELQGIIRVILSENIGSVGNDAASDCSVITLDEDDLNTLRLVECIEEILLDGLLKPIWRQYGTLWDLAERMETISGVNKDIISFVRRSSKARTPDGMGRAWIRAALNEKSLYEDLEALSQSSAVTDMYSSSAVLRHKEMSSLLFSILAALSSLKFDISVTDPNIDAKVEPDLRRSSVTSERRRRVSSMSGSEPLDLSVPPSPAIMSAVPTSTRNDENSVKAPESKSLHTSPPSAVDRIEKLHRDSIASPARQRPSGGTAEEDDSDIEEFDAGREELSEMVARATNKDKPKAVEDELSVLTFGLSGAVLTKEKLDLTKGLVPASDAPISFGKSAVSPEPAANTAADKSHIMMLRRSEKADLLVEEVRESTKNLMRDATEGRLEGKISMDNVDLKRVFNAVEQVLLEGMNEKKKFFWDKDHTLWNLVEHLEKINKDAKTVVRAVKDMGVKSDTAKARAWIKTSLATKTLSSSLSCLIDNGELMGEWYLPGAAMRNQELTDIIVSLLGGVESLEFEPLMLKPTKDTSKTNSPPKKSPKALKEKKDEPVGTVEAADDALNGNEGIAKTNPQNDDDEKKIEETATESANAEKQVEEAGKGSEKESNQALENQPETQSEIETGSTENQTGEAESRMDVSEERSDLTGHTVETKTETNNDEADNAKCVAVREQNQSLRHKSGNIINDVDDDVIEAMSSPAGDDEAAKENDDDGYVVAEGNYDLESDVPTTERNVSGTEERPSVCVDVESTEARGVPEEDPEEEPPEDEKDDVAASSKEGPGDEEQHGGGSGGVGGDNAGAERSSEGGGEGDSNHEDREPKDSSDDKGKGKGKGKARDDAVEYGTHDHKVLDDEPIHANVDPSQGVTIDENAKPTNDSNENDGNAVEGSSAAIEDWGSASVATEVLPRQQGSRKGKKKRKSKVAKMEGEASTSTTRSVTAPLNLSAEPSATLVESIDDVLSEATRRFESDGARLSPTAAAEVAALNNAAPAESTEQIIERSPSVGGDSGPESPVSVVIDPSFGGDAAENAGESDGQASESGALSPQESPTNNPLLETAAINNVDAVDVAGGLVSGNDNDPISGEMNTEAALLVDEEVNDIAQEPEAIASDSAPAEDGRQEISDESSVDSNDLVLDSDIDEEMETEDTAIWERNAPDADDVMGEQHVVLGVATVAGGAAIAGEGSQAILQKYHSYNSVEDGEPSPDKSELQEKSRKYEEELMARLNTSSTPTAPSTSSVLTPIGTTSKRAAEVERQGKVQQRPLASPEFNMTAGAILDEMASSNSPLLGGRDPRGQGTSSSQRLDSSASATSPSPNVHVADTLFEKSPPHPTRPSASPSNLKVDVESPIAQNAANVSAPVRPSLASSDATLDPDFTPAHTHLLGKSRASPGIVEQEFSAFVAYADEMEKSLKTIDDMFDNFARDAGFRITPTAERMERFVDDTSFSDGASMSSMPDAEASDTSAASTSQFLSTKEQESISRSAVGPITPSMYGSEAGEQLRRPYSNSRQNTSGVSDEKIIIAITGTETCTDGNGYTYMAYKIKVTTGSNRHSLLRRYREFVDLLWALQKEFPFMVLPGSAKKVLKGRLSKSRTAAVIEYRRDLLHTLLQDLLAIDTLRRSGLVRDFLDIPDSGAEQQFAGGFRLKLHVDYLPKATDKECSTQSSCPGCGKALVAGYITNNFRFCEYSGYYFCKDCHKGDTYYIPSRILMNWDFRVARVSVIVRSYLERISEQPVFNVSAVNPVLYQKISLLREIRRYRFRLMQMKDFMSTCKYRKVLFSRIGRCYYYMENTEFYSLMDLIDISKGAFGVVYEKVKAMHYMMHKHITRECDTCRGKGFFCEFCNSSKPIYAFEVDSSIQCLRCKAYFHKDCYNEDDCPKCARLEMRTKPKPRDAREIFMS